MKDPIKKIVILFFCIMFSQYVFGQKNFLKGYIINLKGDTVHGLIDFRNRRRSPEIVAFKKDESKGSVSYFTPKDIRGFEVMHNYYRSAIVNIETSLFNANERSSGKELKIISDTVFLQILVEGSKSLFFYDDKSGKEQFYIKKDDSYELLVYNQYVVEADDQVVGGGVKNKSDYIKENKKFLSQLAGYLQDCPNIYAKLEKTGYEIYSLESIFNYYYDHTSNKPEIQTKAEKLSAHVGILSGMTSSKMAYNNYASNFADPVFGKSVNIAGGIFLNIGFPKNQGKLSLMNELIFTTYKFKDSVSEGMYTNTYILGYSYIKLNNIIRYKFPLGNFSVFFDAGISNGYAIHETNFWQRFSDYSVYAPARAISEIRKYEQSYLLGIGSGFKNFTFELRREKGNGITDFETLNSATTRLYFLLGYQF